MITGWTPQYEVLKRPSTILFLSHCGMNSLSEAIATNTTVICLPFFGDQLNNAARLKYFGLSSNTLYYQEIRSDLVYNALDHALSNYDQISIKMTKSSYLMYKEGGLKKALEVINDIIDQYPYIDKRLPAELSIIGDVWYMIFVTFCIAIVIYFLIQKFN